MIGSIILWVIMAALLVLFLSLITGRISLTELWLWLKKYKGKSEKVFDDADPSYGKSFRFNQGYIILNDYKNLEDEKDTSERSLK